MLRLLPAEVTNLNLYWTWTDQSGWTKVQTRVLWVHYYIYFSRVQLLTRVCEITDNHKFIAAGLKRHLIPSTGRALIRTRLTTIIRLCSRGALLLFSETFLVPRHIQSWLYPLLLQRLRGTQLTR